MAGRVVIVTGGSRGIGHATAMAFARAGGLVAVVSLEEQEGEAAASEIKADGGDAMSLLVDVSDEQQVEGMVRQVAGRWGGVDVLVNNAGLYVKGDASNTDLATWDRILATNLTGAFLCTRHAAALMRPGGVIVNVSSEAGLVGIADQVAYNVSKAGVIGLTRSCAVDFADRGIRVNCVCPGTTETPLVRQALARTADPVAARRALEDARPLRRLGTPDEIASAIVFAASAEAAYMTGTVISIDGGYTAR
jgi:NAD(P)-dependent dehydrogenase (short-subunit alcohol dehydrogenase family)